MEIDHQAVIRDRGDMTVEQFRKLIRCSECGTKTEDIRIGYVGKTGFAYRDRAGPTPRPLDDPESKVKTQ